MSPVFADTFYFLALLNQRDSAHQKAITASQSPELLLVTTEFVLLELGDALSKPPSLRADFQAICALIRSSAFFRLVRASSELLERGRRLYHDRPDKEWQLTDCVSFVIMQEENITDALTGDRHFEQAGFKALLK